MPYSSDYLETNKQQFFKETASILKVFRAIEEDNEYLESISLALSKTLKGLNDSDVLKLKNKLITESRLGKDVEDSFDKNTSSFSNFLTIRYRKALIEAWERGFNLGIEHQVRDFLYQLPVFREVLEKPNKHYTNFANSQTLVEFAARKDKKKIDRNKLSKKALRDSNRKITNLRRSKAKLEADGMLYGNNRDYQLKEYMARLNIVQKLSFFDTVKEIKNFRQKADLMRSDYLNSSYLNSRVTVLSGAYTKKENEKVKQLIAGYLSEDIDKIAQARRTGQSAELVAKEIKRVLSERARKGKKDPNAQRNQQFKILRTEVNYAYNFGKLAGFLSPEDSQRLFRWRSDRELEDNNPDYLVCKFCWEMNRRADAGEYYTAAQILAMGVGQGGVASYKSKTTITGSQNITDFKNLNRPMIPFHPNCSCYWMLVPDEELRRQKLKKSVEVIAKGALVTGGFILAGALAYSALSKSAKNVLLEVAEQASTTKTVTVKVPKRRIDRFKDIDIPVEAMKDISIPIEKITEVKKQAKAVEEVVEDVVQTGKYIEENIPEASVVFKSILKEMTKDNA